MARIADPHNRCVIARHLERKLVAVQSISPEQLDGTNAVTVTMHPQCLVSGRLTAKELEARNRKLISSGVLAYLGDGIGWSMSCISQKADYHFYLPPGTFTLQARGTDTQKVWKTITVKPGREKLELEPIDLPLGGLAMLEGRPAPELRDIVAWKNGGPIKISDLRGKVVILAFSFTLNWEEGYSFTPGLFPLYDKYHDQGLVIIEVRLGFGPGIDSKAKLDVRVAEVKTPFWKYRDFPAPIALVLMRNMPPRMYVQGDGTPILDDYGLHSIPTSVLIDRQGRVVGRYHPTFSTDQALLEKVLKDKPAAADGKSPPSQTRATTRSETPLAEASIHLQQLLVTVANEHRANLERIRTWQGTIQVNEKTVVRQDKEKKELKEPIVIKSEVSVDFVYDRGNNAFRSNYACTNYVKSGAQDKLGLRGYPPITPVTNIMVLKDTYYRCQYDEGYDFMRSKDSTKDVPVIRVVVIDPKDERRASTDGQEIDPFYWFSYRGRDVAEVFTAHYNWDREEEHQSHARLKQIGNIVVFEQRSDSFFEKYTVDRLQGANLVEFRESRGDNGRYVYTNVGGAWVPKSVTIETNAGNVATRTRTLRWIRNVVNEPISGTEFSLLKLGLRRGDRVQDNLTGKSYSVEGSEYPAGPR
jgi:hypothetical protein